ncbi:MAG: nucleotidyl transferase AbiEii/AbiGii toxin family protein [Candidatus Aminicenantes bacterium]|nr:nucleotidyl transferase AbiEii/AbiGii toxin family protein [Candidatus Aminicenantes bacterium]
MDRTAAESLSREIGIAVEQVVREELELAILKSLFESRMGDALVFKGGTALRLAYGSPRFSDDLDFSALGPIKEEDFEKACRSAAKAVPDAALVEALAKHFTLFALLRFRVPYIGRPFSMKVEVSLRKAPWKKGRDYELKLLSSEVTNVTALAQVATLERMEKDKREALEVRCQPRDLYDLWFISQKLGRDLEADASGIPPTVLRRELRKYLPRGQWRLVEKWIA